MIHPHDMEEMSLFYEGPSESRVGHAISTGERSLRRKAMNRACKLGQLYSGVKDEIMPEFMLTGEVPEDAVLSVDMKGTYLSWEEEFSTKDRFKSLEVEGELKLSIMLGLADVKAASKYLTSVTKSSTCVRICMVYRIVTKEETLDLQHDDVARMFRLEALQDSPATHVVVGIQWGYSGVIVFEQGVTQDETRHNAELSLKASLNTGLASSILPGFLSDLLPDPGEGGVTLTPRELQNGGDNLKRRSVKIIADIMPQNVIEPTDFQSALEFARSVTDEQHIKINGGRGKPQEIHLLSVEAVCQKLRTTFVVQGTILKTLSSDVIAAVEKELERLADMTQLLNLTYEEVEEKARKVGIAEDELTGIDRVQTEIAIETMRFRAVLRDLLVDVRSGIKEEGEIGCSLREFEQAKCSAAGLNEHLKTLKVLEEKVNFLEYMQGKGMEILREGTDRDSLVAANITVSSLYILCYDNKERVQRRSSWICNYELFENLIEKSEAGGKSKLFLLDYASCQSWDRDQDVCIQLYRGGLWNSDYLKTVQSTRLSSDEMNLLLLGQTGVGKSTFINAFYNYLSYDSLEEAEQGGVKVAIPSMFTEVDRSVNENTVTVGDNSLEDENFEDPSQSSTQRCKSYVFRIEADSGRHGSSVRLIDTPGIGDTRGVAWDKQNIKNILIQLKKFKHIHGICIFLKPNESRLNIFLEYCITELLVHLHKNASRNVAFCFTSAKSTNFHVCGTLKPLRTLLDNIQRKKQVSIQITESTMYCFDNEAFRYLAACQKPQGPSFQTERPGRSWDQSVKECKRLLSKFNSVGAHLSEETVDIIKVKSIIESLEEPMMTLSEDIIEQSNAVERTRKEIEDTKEDPEALKMVLMKPTKVVESIIYKLAYPRTVCRSPACTTHVDLKDGRTQSIYRVCHDRCTGYESSFKIFQAIGIRLCSSMLAGKCIKCKCRARDHKFVTSELKQGLRDMPENPIDGDDLRPHEETSAAAIKRSALKRYETRLMELEEEKKYINDAQIKFAFFLQEHSFTSTNDYKSRYLDRQVFQLESKLASAKNMDQDRRKMIVDRIEDLKSRSDKYKKEFREFAALLKGQPQADDISVGNIKAILNGLRNLPTCGSAFETHLDLDAHEQQLDDSCLEFLIEFTAEREAHSDTSLPANLLLMEVHRQRSRIHRD
ncbi:hypothetical protein MPTK1_8g00310 [Marchantia polymorpha subsp. ruderalis]|uniref:Uncharacterized protein n=1 Tax=Marchantia polymorpha TaxID=3197 RepID=A0A2R6WLH8_MARPO|nr:hypothetical protein MARPO_0077s0038 [Marchantia polymorpha]BBN18172.1 hypothetical protein Mp_8g00310 [Marchantia polymorpha subsp. ruderalis]|eukprot:PTQ34710.1 hypothetical protein MARPO_0077s0038 [Marchantia polymorpha]